MIKCKTCSAGLPANSGICSYCGTVNDVDLTRFDNKKLNLVFQENRGCPVCKIKMKTIDVGLGVNLLIDRCEKCYGLFFDKNELTKLIKSNIKSKRQIDPNDLQRVFTEFKSPEQNIHYKACPVCGKLMNRKPYGARSGIVIDYCKDHGIWLDSGELRQILEWTIAGGEVLNEEEKLKRKIEDKQSILSRRTQADLAHLRDENYRYDDNDGFFSNLLDAVFDIIFW